MKKFLLLYRATDEAIEQMDREYQSRSVEEIMLPWQEWQQRWDGHIVDMGDPVDVQHLIDKDMKILKQSDDVVGYSIIAADDLKQATTILENHPLFNSSSENTISLYELVHMN